jgi:hypothetical protein
MAGAFANAGASVQLVYNQNTTISQCLFGALFGGPLANESADQITAEVQDKIGGALTDQLNRILRANPNALSNMATAAVNAGFLTRSGLAKADPTGPTPALLSWSCQAAPGCVPALPASTSGPAGSLLVYCTDVCAGNTPPGPFTGLGPGALCFNNGQCASGTCSSTTDTGSPPFVCTDVACVPPCEIAGSDGFCHNSGDSGCTLAP